MGNFVSIGFVDGRHRDAKSSLVGKRPVCEVSRRSESGLLKYLSRKREAF